MPDRLTAIGLSVVGLLLAANAAAADVAMPPFYQAAGALAPDGPLGKVLKSEPVQTSIPGAHAWRIAYVSSDVGGRKTISTGLVVAPSAPAPKEGRPVIAWAHGTTGTAQNCGPSQVPDPAQALNEYFLIGGNSWTDYGLPSVETFVKDGYVVVGTDYQGLGAGGKHQYSVAATNGRDAINSVRAVASMSETGAGKTAVMYGWSQGGGATLAAASLGDYIAQTGTAADGVEFLGFAALAPDDVAAAAPSVPADEASAEKLLGGLTASFSDNVFNFTHFIMFMWGSQAAFPDLKLADIFTEDGAAMIDAIVSQKCVHVTSDTLNYAVGANYKSLLLTTPTNALAWSNALIKGSVEPVKPVAPVIIYWGTHDTVVPPVMGEVYRKQMCGLGGNITRVQLPGEQTHFSTPGASAPLYVPWIEDRVAGKPIADGCKSGG
ncbi:lipase family protein [Kaistia algarum]|uniref:lipase family protein n=1 Tax=Kaistia algarum TaxID=2083279 RepID=UPI00224CECE7|nr:lipase family protein [Kaistia algarum]MCX5514596.1 acetylxylan esterase [Kaistia algarum]